ncbi:MAG: pseudouridine synthase [Thermaerobacter sp.]|nr:pseudouridine synthase [Thermaerobacter sp.]
MGIRVQRLIAQAGMASRRTAEQWVKAGKVHINGQTAVLGAIVEPGVDTVTVNHQMVTPATARWVLALNKPVGYTTSLRDRHAEHLVSELIPAQYGRLFPVGRLDRDTSGLLLMTNDGDLAFRLSHPSFAVPKIYEAWVAGIPKAGHLQRLERGIMLDGGRARAHEVRVVERVNGNSRVRLTLTEGKKREVRRIFAAVGHPVLSLQRVAFAGILLEDLAEGACRPLTHRELKSLAQRVNPPSKKTSQPVRDPRGKGEDRKHGESQTPGRGGIQHAGRAPLSSGGPRDPLGHARGNPQRPHG